MKVTIVIENHKYIKSIFLIADEVGNFESVELAGKFSVNSYMGNSQIHFDQGSQSTVCNIAVLTENDKISYILNELNHINKANYLEGIYQTLIGIFNSLEFVDVAALMRDCNNKRFTLEGITQYFEKMNKVEIANIFDKKLKQDFLKLLEKNLDLNLLDIDNLSKDSIKICTQWINELLKLKGFERPGWLIESQGCYLKVLKINSEYLDENEEHPAITCAKTMPDEYKYPIIIVRSEDQCSIFGCHNGEWDETPLNLDVLKVFEKYNFQSGFVSERSNKEIFNIVKMGHTQNHMLSFLNKLIKKLEFRSAKELEKISDVEGYPTKEKVKKIFGSNDWLQFSIASKKASNGQTKPYIDLAERPNQKMKN